MRKPNLPPAWRNSGYRKTIFFDALEGDLDTSEWTGADWRRWSEYNLTPEDYQELLDEQENSCAICGQSGGKRSLVVDHDHFSGEVRGLLCDICNMGLGYFHELPALFRRAAEYIEYYDSL